ncbi:MAG: protein kinase [Rhodanobacteraceae bacterium]
MTDLSGRSIAQHQVLARLGRGGMADVYKVLHPGLAIHRALKVIRPELSSSGDFRERFQREAQAIASLRHPGIVQVHDFGEQDGLYYIVMEFIDGNDLARELAQRGKLPVNEGCRIVMEVLDALSQAHKAGIVHRDVKSANIMLTSAGRAILTDFGIAKMLESESSMTQTGTGVGTPAYMAPEQAKGLRDIGPRADIYAMGVVLYELLTGSLPYDADTPLAVIHKLINDPIPLPRKRNPGIPRAVERVILKATAKNPDARYTSTQDFKVALKRALGKVPPEAATTQIVRDNTAAPRSSWRRRLVLGGIAALALVGAIGFAYVQSRSPASSDSQATDPWTASKSAETSAKSASSSATSAPAQQSAKDLQRSSVSSETATAQPDTKAAVLNRTEHGKIAIIGQTARYPFAARAGDTVSVALRPEFKAAFMTLRAPDGSQVATSSGNPLVPRDLVIRNQKLPADGTYTVEIGGAGSNKGAYTLGIARPAYQNVPLKLNTETAGHIDFPGKGYWYRFEGHAGTRIRIVLSPGFTNMYLGLYAPDDSRLAWASGNPYVANDLEIRDQPLAVDGRYAVLVVANDAGTGKYALAVTSH